MMYHLDGRRRRQSLVYFASRKSHPRMSPWGGVFRGAVCSGRGEGMFLGRYSEIFGRGDRLGCILNLSHSFDAIEAYL